MPVRLSAAHVGRSRAFAQLHGLTSRVALLLVVAAVSLLMMGAAPLDDSQQRDALMPSGLPPETEALFEQYTDLSPDEGISRILGSADTGGAIKSAIGPAVTVLIILLLCGFFETVIDDKHSQVVQLACTLAITAAAATNIGGLMTSGRALIETLDTTSKALLASLSAASGVLGAPASSASKFAASMLFSSALVTVVDRLLIPIVFAYVAVSAANAAIGENALERMGKLLKWVVGWTLGILLTAFVAFITVSGIVSGGADALAVKTAKTVISGAVPIVGGIIGDAAETVLASARLVRNAAGLAGMLAATSLVVTPFLRLCAQYLLFRAAGAAAAPLSKGRLAKLVEDIAAAYALILAMVASCLFLLLMSVVSLITIYGG